MRIHSDTLTRQDFTEAAKAAGASIVWIEFKEHGSRSRARAFTFHLAGSSSYRGGWAGNNGYNAATWDEWGIVFNHLFDVDALAHTGKWPYSSGEHFHWVTGGRFRNLTPSQQHARHKWNPLGAVTGSYAVAECKCGATQRWMIHGHVFAELAS